mgnify:FL=1
MININYNDEPRKKLIDKNSHLRIMTDFLLTKEKPVILEFGVERGLSTNIFIWLAEQVGGKVYSIDIDDCSKVATSEHWQFLQSDDLKIEYILSKFPEIKELGVDLIYIDSYHENFHVQKLIMLWFKYLKKEGAIFIDDIDSEPFRRNKDVWNSIVYDLTDEAIKDFYYSNKENVFYTKYFGENGLAKLLKLSELFSQPNDIKKIWSYNIFIKIAYPYLRKLRKLFRFK